MTGVARRRLTGHISDLSANQRRQWLDPFEVQRLDDHVFNCDGCRISLVEQTRAESALHSLFAALQLPHACDEHLSGDTLQKLSGGALNQVDRELAESHLADCLICQALVHGVHA
jgi:hypothetical protein